MPVLILVVLICSGSFYFQNKISPEANKQLYTLLWSMRQKSPELDIPEGIFYSDIPGYNLYVERKDAETGMLYGVMIYTNTENYEDTQIVIADSGRLQSTADKTHLKLTLYDGERFKNMDNQSGAMLRANIPYMRESFIEEVDYIAFNTQFNLWDANLFAGNAQAKNLEEIYRGIDSIRSRTDSIGHSIYDNAKRTYLARMLTPGRKDSAKIVKEAAEIAPFDSLFAQLRDDQKSTAWKNAFSRAETMLYGRLEHPATQASYGIAEKIYPKPFLPIVLLYRSTIRSYHPQGRIGNSGCSKRLILHLLLYHQCSWREQCQSGRMGCIFWRMAKQHGTLTYWRMAYLQG